MNLHFVCRCEGDCNPQLVAEINSQFRMALASVSGCKIAEDSNFCEAYPGLGIGAGELGFQLEFECVPEEESLDQSHQIVSLLSQLSSDHSLECSLGHQMEQALGAISRGVPDSNLEQELGTSLRVAQALGQVNVDDEWLDEEELGQMNTNQETDSVSEDSWSGLMDTTEEFVRFPKFDEP